MKNNLLHKIINLDGFIIERSTQVDKKEVFIRPLYIELLSLYPLIQKSLADEISNDILKYKPKVLYAIEASVLPIAALVSDNLKIPMSIIRKPRNYKHENEEPELFIIDELRKCSSVLLDDAIWSGYTINYTFQILKKYGIQIPQCYFIFDFLDFNDGGCFLNENDLLYLKNRRYWTTYKNIIDISCDSGVISNETYRSTMQLFL